MVFEHKNTFTDWLERVDMSREEAGQMLGKSPRMIKYYIEGRPLSLSTIILMDALERGYRPKTRLLRRTA